MRLILTLLLTLTLTLTAHADDHLPLSAQDVAWVEGIGSFGQPIFTARGVLVNTSADQAYTDITLTIDAYDADNALIGAGIGVLVNACGAGLRFDYALQPDADHFFSAPLEVFEQDAEIARLEIAINAAPIDPIEAPALADGITRIDTHEAVMVEWIDDTTLRYATGCENHLFTEWDWYSYNLTRARSTRLLTHPLASYVDDDLRERLRLQDDAIFANSLLRYAADGDRLLYQDAKNDLISAAFDGRFPRLIYSALNSYSLRNIYWQPDERFIAYYFGAFGDPVLYFTATAESVRISPALLNNPPSVIVPGITRDARRVVLAGTFDDVTGYYLYVVSNNFFELLFEGDSPGNNYPAPLVLTEPEDDLVNQMYVARDVDGVPTLQCFNREAGELIDLTPLPIRLTTDERAWWWLSPDESTIALVANGVNGGAWLIDLEALPACAA